MLGAVAFLTAVPAGRTRAPDRNTADWFPIVGLCLGLVLGAAWWAAGEVWSPLPAAVAVVVADLVLTGMLHVDGLADSADGLVPQGWPVERRLAAMAEPTVGAYGVVAITVVLLARVAALAAVDGLDDGGGALFVVAALWCASRTVMAVGLRAVTYVGGGLAAELGGGDWRRVAAQGATLAVVVAALASGPRGVVAVLVAAAAGAAVLAAARRRLGGFTGDVLGAAGVVSETVGLFVVAAR